jgi:hypothetical protein
MQLKAPAEYWSSKATQHKTKVVFFTRWSVGVGIAGVAMILLAAWYILPEHYPSGTIPWRSLGIFVLISTYVVYLLKLAIKLLLSNIHLAADADERVVMIETYTALIRSEANKASLTPADLALVLAPIFRPSSTGVIKDDGGPLALSEFINRVVGDKTGH